MGDQGAFGPAVEREVKLGAWPGFEVPDFTGVTDGLTMTPQAELKLDAVYFDTSDLRLIRRGITVRHRAGDGDGWTVKFPERGGAGDVLVRREVTVGGAAETVPADVARLVAAHVRTADLEPVAHLRTYRRRLQLLGADGVPLGEVDDDEVSVLDGSRVAARFRELEAELFPGAPSELLLVLVERLREAGAGVADPTPKLVRALGPRALSPPELIAPQVSSRDEKPTAADLLRAELTTAVARIVDHHPVIRLDEDPEGVHQARVGTRRLRSVLRMFALVLDRDWSEPLREELGWLASCLGVVRDADVLRARILRQAASLPEPGDRRGADALLTRLDDERQQALARLLDALASRRYFELLDRLVAAATDPRLDRDADLAAAEVLPRLVSRPWGRVVKAVAGLGPRPTADDLHRVRIHAKRARYAADVAIPVIGAPARDLASALADLQDVLGDHQDAAVAEAWLRQTGVDASPAEALVAGQLVAVQRAEAASRRAAWPAAWKAATKRAGKKKVSEWLS